MKDYIWVKIPYTSEDVFICKEGHIKRNQKTHKNLKTIKFDWVDGEIDYDISYVIIIVFLVSEYKRMFNLCDW